MAARVSLSGLVPGKKIEASLNSRREVVTRLRGLFDALSFLFICTIASGRAEV
jgi:hypothetical protein